MPKSALAQELNKISAKDRKQIEQAQEMFGPDPEQMGFVKHLFWGRFDEEQVFPYPDFVPAEEKKRCDALLEKLDDYLRNEHPHLQIDREQLIPDWCIQRLFQLGVMGMIVPQAYGGGGFSITSYNRVLQRIGETCGSTAVMVSAHQSIGCGALKLFGSEEQKQRFLPQMGRDTLSAFCLSEPNVGCDAGGQETRCELSSDGTHYVLNGEKKWATSGALAGLFTVMAKQKVRDARGEEIERVTALICTPDMNGIEIFSRNRSKCGIRGTWQARIRFTNVKVPVANRLHEEGRGLTVALTCLNYGRCTLSAGMVGAGRAAFRQAVKWAHYRYQFDRPIAEFEQIRELMADMAAWVYAMEAMLYMTTGMIDRGDKDIMLETAVCKVFCSDIGFRTVDHALEIMGGEGYMTENIVERLWRDSRINIIVEGANEVMHSFVFGYGSRQLGESLLDIRARPLAHAGPALRTAAALFLRMRRSRPRIGTLHPSLSGFRRQLETHVRDLNYHVKRMLQIHQERIMTRQLIHARLSWATVWIHAMTCTLARLDATLRSTTDAARITEETTVATHLCALAGERIRQAFAGLYRNTDDTLHAAAEAAMAQVDREPNSDYAIPEKTPDQSARGTGRDVDMEFIQQFGAGSLFGDLTTPRSATATR